MQEPKVALITGASSGIGKAVAVELGRRGFKLGLVARREKELGDVAAACAAAGAPEALARTADVADRAATEAAAAEIERRFGRIDLLVASAGIGMPKTPREKVLDVDAVEKTLRVNVHGVVYAIGAVLPGMLARGAGHLCAISSLAGTRGLPRSHAYNASKAALNVFLESLRIDLRGRGVLVTVVKPGFVDTPILMGNADKLPFVVPADRAARKIVNGLERGRRTIEFPFPLAAAIKLGKLLVPDWLYERFMKRAEKLAPAQSG